LCRAETMVRVVLTLLVALAQTAQADNPAGQPFTDGSFTLTQNDPLTGQSVSRPVWVNVPDGTGPFPVLIYCHGNGGQSTQLPTQRLAAVSLEDSYVLAKPNGHELSWNVVAEDSQMDDVAFVHAILDQLATYPNVNVHKTHLWGFSNGAALTNRVMIESDDTRIVGGVTEVSQLNAFQYHNGQFWVGTRSGSDTVTYDTAKGALTQRRVFAMQGDLDGAVPTCACNASIGPFDMVADDDSVYAYAQAYGYTGAKLSPTVHGSGNDAYEKWVYPNAQAYTAFQKAHQPISEITEIATDLLAFFSAGVLEGFLEEQPREEEPTRLVAFIGDAPASVGEKKQTSRTALLPNWG